MERLQKIIARAGICSRRAAEELIRKGRVRVNGKVVTELGAKADPRNDKVEVDNKRIEPESLLYVVLHKPRGYVSTLEDPEGRPTVADLISEIPERLHPVGRLDFATSGVLLMTNDGDLTNKLLHPSSKAPKTYVVKLDKLISDEELEAWRTGIKLDDGPTMPAEARRIRNDQGKSWIQITLREGRNQQLRRMAAAQGFVAMRLARLSFAGIENTDLKPGAWRPLTIDELRKLKANHGVPTRVRPQNSLVALQKKIQAKEDAAKKRPRTFPKKGTAAQRPKGPNARKRVAADQAAEPKAKPRRRPSGTASETPRKRSRPTRSSSGERPNERSTTGQTDRTGTKPRGAAPRASRDRGRGRR